MFFLAEKTKLRWAKNNQKKIKAEKYSGLIDALYLADDKKDLGVKIILPPSHIGSPRWYTEQFQDAMAIGKQANFSLFQSSTWFFYFHRVLWQNLNSFE